MLRKFLMSDLSKKTGIDFLIDSNPLRMNPDEREAMTISCSDTAYIPKVAEAGEFDDYKGEKIQIMHNGLRVIRGGYHGDWMAGIIKSLKGHHEPQEEKVFYEVVERLKKDKKRTKYMLELGSFWAYYSMWFKKDLPGSLVYCFEPDPQNITIGRKNAALNGLDITFQERAAGSQDGKRIKFQLDSDQAKHIDTTIKSVDKFTADSKIPYVDMLHMDVQGAELDALIGTQKLIDSDGLRFLFVSTHHYTFSRDVLTHQKCLDFIKHNNGHVISSHNVLESYSGDGLIVASFNNIDSDFKVETSINSSQQSLFRPYEEDLALLLQER